MLQCRFGLCKFTSTAYIRFNLIPSSNLEKKSSKVFDMTGFDPQISELTENGAWCWFADPRAIYFKGTVCRVSFFCKI